MSFLQEYKRLDNLCRDLLKTEKGITAYIENMDMCASNAKWIAGWTQDYKKLKYLRNIRNRIVHENDMDEETLCNDSDEEWLVDFRERILKCCDPLALYAQSCQKQKENSKKIESKEIGYNRDQTAVTEENEDKPYVLIFAIICVCLVLIIGGIIGLEIMF